MTPSQRLRHAIKNAKLGYMEIEEKTGMSKSSVQRYATGTTKKIPIDAVEKLAPLLNVSPAYLMGWTDDPTPPKNAKSKAKWEPIITPKNERDVLRDLELMMNGDAVIAAYGGKLPDEMNEEEREDYEIYKSAMHTILMHAKKINKKTHTPLKYRVVED